jgi:hypothetical protein
MTTENTAALPAAPTDTTITGTAPAAAPEKPRVQADQLPPDALSARLEQAKESARKALLAELGITDATEAKTAIADAAARKEAAKTADQRVAELSLQVANQTAALQVAVDHASKSITPEQRQAVDAIAGTDQALWLRTYGALAPTWGAPPMAAPAPVATPHTPPPNTAPTTPAPLANSNNTSPPDHAAVYQRLQQTNPFVAARYLQLHGDQCAGKR